jgi:hypothetical protein
MINPLTHTYPWKGSYNLILGFLTPTDSLHTSLMQILEKAHQLSIAIIPMGFSFVLK